MTRPRTVQIGAIRSNAGMSLIELIVGMGIMTLIMGGVFAAMMEALRADETVKLTTGMNANLRVAMDLLVRDAIQAGQGLPAGKVVSVPSGSGAMPIVRPGPVGTDYTFDPALASLPAVVVGPDLGPVVTGQATDMVTLLAADNVLNQVEIVELTAGSLRLSPDVDNTDMPDVQGDNVRPGDLLMLTKGSMSTLKFVTDVAGDEVFFDEGDPLNLNQSGAEHGTLAQYVAAAPVDVAACPLPPRPCTFQIVPSVATRIRMISYYLETPGGADDDLRLIRRINANPPTAVAFSIESFVLSYDLVDGVANPVDVRMMAADVTGGGACAPSPCSPNQIRKLNVTITGRSAARHSQTNQFLRNTLATQVSLRNLALVDRYS